MLHLHGPCKQWGWMHIVKKQGQKILANNIRLSSSDVAAEKKAKPLNKELCKEAETVIIGGGALGCGIAYHLAKLGQKGVVLLEKSELTAGSTWHAAGLTAFYHPMANMKKIHYYSINLYSQLERETGQAVGFHRTGSIRLATTPERVDEMKYQMSKQGYHKNPQRIVSPEEIQKMCPVLNMSTILSGLYNAYDGHIDPYSLAQALAVGARKYGAEIYMPVEVTNLKCLPDGKWMVETPHGAITANRVVNAAGFWAREVGKLAGLDLPLVPVHHQYVVTQSIPELEALKKEIPVLRHLEGSLYVRQEKKGLVVGPYESPETMKLCEDWALDRVPPGFGKELFQPDVDRITPNLNVAMEAIPCLASARIQTVVSGPITYSPDSLPLIGPTLLPNMWLAVGFSYGIIHAGGMGKYLADWIVRGEPPGELIEADPLRFSDWTTLDFTFGKARESYGLNRAITHPFEERFAGRPTSRVSGAYEMMKARGAHMDFHTGWEQPSYFSSPGEEIPYEPSFYRANWHKAVMNGCDIVMNKVGIIDLSPFGKIELRGPDSWKFLENVTSNSPPKTGKTCITHCLTKAGKVYAEFTVTALENKRFLILTGSGSELHDLRWLQEKARLGNYNVTFENKSDSMGCLSIAGPKAGDLMQKLIDADIQNFPFLSAKDLSIGDIKVLALRISYTGELGWELYCKQSDVKGLYEKLLEAGEEFGVGDFGTFSLNVLRMEKGFRMWGAEMNTDTSPLEAGLQPFLKMDKQNFLGKEALEQELREGLQRKLVTVVIDSENVDPKGDETVWCCGKVVGNTTSGCFSYTLQKPIAFAYVPLYLAETGTTVEVELMGKLCPAEVLLKPIVKAQPLRQTKAKAI